MKMDGGINTSKLVSSSVGHSDGDFNVFKNKRDNLRDTKDFNLISILSTDPLLLSLLVASSLSLVLILLHWTYLLYSTCKNSSGNITQPPFKHQVLFGLLNGSSCSLSHVIWNSTSLTFTFIDILTPISYTIFYSNLLVRLVYLQSVDMGIVLSSL